MKLRISRLLWHGLVGELRARGGNRRESGAFLLGKPKSNRVSVISYYDDLEATALDSGYVSLTGEAFAKLWQFCQERELEPLADIHTHGGEWTGQSETDITNPFVAFPGHLSLITPYYARKNSWSLSGVGIYEYLGDHKWKTFAPRDKRVELVLL
jgi:proteasome lid subunit RPN8/RPN11